MATCYSIFYVTKVRFIVHVSQNDENGTITVEMDSVDTYSKTSFTGNSTFMVEDWLNFKQRDQLDFISLDTITLHYRIRSGGCAIYWTGSRGICQTERT